MINRVVVIEYMSNEKVVRCRKSAEGSCRWVHVSPAGCSRLEESPTNSKK
jgi:hypothetical protein